MNWPVPARPRVADWCQWWRHDTLHDFASFNSSFANLWSSQVWSSHFWCAGQHSDRIFSHLLHQLLGAQSKSGTHHLPINAKESCDAACDPFFKEFEMKHIHKKAWISKTFISQFLGGTVSVKSSGIERNGTVFLGKSTGNHCAKVDLKKKKNLILTCHNTFCVCLFWKMGHSKEIKWILLLQQK